MERHDGCWGGRQAEEVDPNQTQSSDMRDEHYFMFRESQQNNDKLNSGMDWAFGTLCVHKVHDQRSSNPIYMITHQSMNVITIEPRFRRSHPKF